MRTWIGVVAAACAVALSPVAFGAEPASGCGIPQDIHDGWAMTSPDKQGLNAALLCTMEEGISLGKLANVDDIVVVRHGVLVYERYYDYPHQLNYDATTRHNGYSMTKSVVSLLVGIAMDRGMIRDLDAPIVSYLPDDAGLRESDKDRITLRHLLTMSAGLGFDRTPGVSFAYNNRETELIGAILTRVTGKPVDVLAQENIFAPLGIEDVAWYKDPVSGLPTSASGLSLRPRDWAKIGQLVLNRGAWDGRQIVSASWADQSTAEHIKTREPQSYGYQWWLGRSQDGSSVVDWIAAKGFNSQKTIIIPALDMVVVFNAGRESKNMVAPELDLLDRYIVPATSRD
ncbi:serine hydrolase [Bradyrhizobium diazoefficiens]|uniref:serine hydrolase domain-containing protein n=1 Tax=Bradyrhizobium diazoefficiens TaxID=1355477 RepID=UPI00190E1322|nr:serine hydrolase [Bradyrhizobium diazoefficiens]MBK3662153.1 serine hydrolase [Bradyrhizobium diazoefficiens]